MKITHLIPNAVLLAFLFLPLNAFAQENGGEGTERSVVTVLQMADYIGVDYPEFVKGGEVLDEAEYREQVEFAATIESEIRGLPPRPGKSALLDAATRLGARIAARADGAEVKALTGSIALGLMTHYPVTMAPLNAPDLIRGAERYAQECASCHGATGHGEGEEGIGMVPPPIDFHDRARQGQRNLFGLYNTITLGVADTGMADYAHLSDADRWALAAYVGALPYTAEEVAEGERVWRENLAARQWMSDLGELALRTPDELAGEYGPEAASLVGYLRSHPEALEQGANVALTTAREKLGASAQSYAAGDREGARQSALSAYLDGFELAEPALASINAPLLKEIENAMLDYRKLIRDGAPATEVADMAAHLDGLLLQADDVLSGGGLEGLGAFVASFVILFREGLEAILVLTAIFAFLAKANRPDAYRAIHIGWVSALVLGGVTWFVSSYFIRLSGAGREVTEGVAALLAAALLLYVGFWLHGKSYAQKWQQYVEGQLATALDPGRLWLLAFVTFLAVYREIFETILFYTALWEQGGHTAIVGGFIVAAICLVAVGAAILMLSWRLPITAFFRWSSVLIAVLAVVFVGNGTAALQEAGFIPADRISFISIPTLGIHETTQAIAAQLVMLFLVVAAFSYNHFAEQRAQAQR